VPRGFLFSRALPMPPKHHAFPALETKYVAERINFVTREALKVVNLVAVSLHAVAVSIVSVALKLATIGTFEH
jgi:hypothetical protein